VGAPSAHSANKAKRVDDARTLFQALRSDSEKDFAPMIIGGESWFYSCYELLVMFGHRRDEVIPTAARMIGSNKAMITVLLLAVDC
jgi:hypothetical protein